MFSRTIATLPLLEVFCFWLCAIRSSEGSNRCHEAFGRLVSASLSVSSLLMIRFPVNSALPVSVNRANWVRWTPWIGDIVYSLLENQISWNPKSPTLFLFCRYLVAVVVFLWWNFYFLSVTQLVIRLVYKMRFWVSFLNEFLDRDGKFCPKTYCPLLRPYKPEARLETSSFLTLLRWS